VTGIRKFRLVKRKGIQLCYEKGNICVLGKREYMCVRKKGIQVCQKEGNSYVSDGR
jgi:hypothetical protein